MVIELLAAPRKGIFVSDVSGHCSKTYLKQDQVGSNIMPTGWTCRSAENVEPGGAGAVPMPVGLGGGQVKFREPGILVRHSAHRSKCHRARLQVAPRRACSPGPAIPCTVDQVYAPTQAVCRWEDDVDLHC